MKHLVKLSNGQVLSLLESNSTLNVGFVDKHGDGEDWWICSISRDGILVSFNSGDAPEVLTSGLKSGDLEREHENTPICLLEQLLALTDQFTPNMDSSDRKAWQNISASCADLIA